MKAFFDNASDTMVYPEVIELASQLLRRKPGLTTSIYKSGFKYFNKIQKT